MSFPAGDCAFNGQSFGRFVPRNGGWCPIAGNVTQENECMADSSEERPRKTC